MPPPTKGSVMLPPTDTQHLKLERPRCCDTAAHMQLLERRRLEATMQGAPPHPRHHAPCWCCWVSGCAPGRAADTRS